MTTSTQVAIVGAGPYGLSLAAHLRAHGIGFRIFGRPMDSWRSRMPAGMLLKSEGFASDLADPEKRFTLKQFCRDHGLRYADVGVPVPVETMTEYGLSFQQHLVPELEHAMVRSIERTPKGFRLHLDNGESFTTGHVIVAVGLWYFPYVPPFLAELPSEFVSHSSQHHDLTRFHGCDVTVVGGGASALDLAALLHETGANVRLVARQPSVVFNTRPRTKSLWNEVRYPKNALGRGWKGVFYSSAPMLFRHLPQQERMRIVKTYLGPAGGWFTEERIVGRVPMFLGRKPECAELLNNRICLKLNGNGAPCQLATDHVIAATGYRVDLRRLTLLNQEIRNSVHAIENAPVLSRAFESSVPGLYFVGLTAAPSFGPSMRFVYGARFTARRLSAHLRAVVKA